MPVLDTISWPCFIYWYRCHLKVSPGETVYWWHRVAGIVCLLLLAGVIYNRQFYRVKFFLREMTNISPHRNIFRKYCLVCLSTVMGFICVRKNVESIY